MADENRATVILELADVPGNKDGIANQVESILEDNDIEVMSAHTKYLKEL